MSIESFINAMPKVELHVHLEGAMRPETVAMLAEQNDIPYQISDYEDWIALLNSPDPERYEEIARVISTWFLHPDDLTRLVYDLGVYLSHQNVRYAEVSVSPALYIQHDLTFEDFLAAINDGRDRVQRAWNVEMRWIFNIPRDEPRRSDEIARWATNITSRRAGVVALGLSGREDVQPIGQFQRAFRTALKKELERAPHASDTDAGELMEVLEELQPDRLLGGFVVVDEPEAIRLLAERQIPYVANLTRALRLGLIKDYADFPLRKLYDADVKLIISAAMPMLFDTTLNDEYRHMIESCGFDIDELQEMALNSVRYSLLPDDEKEALLHEFQDTYQQLVAEHLVSETSEE